MGSQNLSLTVWLGNEAIKRKINEALGKNAAKFTSALLNIYQNNKQLQECDGRSILGAAMLAATMDLSITPGLGQAYVLPYKAWDKDEKRYVDKAQFQIGTKGLIQLAHRTGKYVALHAGAIREGEICGLNPVTGEPILGERISDEVVGYVAYMRLNNGFEKTLYMTIAELEEHARKYSQSYGYDQKTGKKSSPWTTNFDAMASKTVLKKLLNTWGILSTDIAEAMQADQSIVDKDTFEYVDNGGTVQSREPIYLPEDDTPTDTEEVTGGASAPTEPVDEDSDPF